MLSFKKIIFTSLFFLSACGYTPLYNDKKSPSLIGQISFQKPNSQDDFIFYSRLNDRFADFGDRYFLDYEISSSTEDKALNFNDTAHRIEIFSSVTFSLKDKKNGTELLSDKEEMYLSYSNSGSTAAVLNAQKNTNEQLIVLLADKVANRISRVIIEESL